MQAKRSWKVPPDFQPRDQRRLDDVGEERRKSSWSWHHDGVLADVCGPRDLASLADAKRYPELADADAVVVITDARDTTALRGLHGLRVVSVR